MRAEDIRRRLKAQANPGNVAGMARFGINPQNTLGVSIPALRTLAKEIGRNHKLAQGLWATRLHEGRILAGMIDDPKLVTEAQMEAWVKDFDSWDVCDQVCSNLFDKTRFAHRKALQWSARAEEFVKRAGFVLMATLAVHDKTAKDTAFLAFLPPIRTGATDERNFVKKAVNWALRQIGKRNHALNRVAIRTANELEVSDSKAARWIATDALRELTSRHVQARLAHSR
jgi:3-methyladenine DNA glycosylase AlkD